MGRFDWLSTLLQSSLRFFQAEPSIHTHLIVVGKARFCPIHKQAPSTKKDLDISKLPSRSGRTILVTSGKFPHVGLRNAGFLF